MVGIKNSYQTFVIPITLPFRFDERCSKKPTELLSCSYNRRDEIETN